MAERLLFGAIPSKHDDRDYSVRALKAVTALPDEYTIKISGKVYDQKVGNCVAQTMRAIFRHHYGVEFGVDFQYGGGRSPSNWTGAGTYPNEVANFCVIYGLAPVANDPNEQEVQGVINYYNRNQARLSSLSKKYSGGTWGRIYSEAELMASIADNKPAAGCFMIAAGNPDKITGIWNCNEMVLGYHEMMIYGYKNINGKRYFRVRNSWGEKWGKSGDSYISWEDIIRCQDVISFALPGLSKDDNSEIQRTLRYTSPRMTGDDVNLCQERLNIWGVKCTVDSRYGSGTRNAVRVFQKQKLLDADGICGAKTWAKLLEDPSSSDTDTDTIHITEADYPNISSGHRDTINSALRGCSSDRIKVVKECLRYMYDAEIGDKVTPTSLYVYGANLYNTKGEVNVATASYIEARADSRPQYFTSGRKEWMLKQIKANPKITCSDCSGMEVGYGRLFGWTTSDYTANGLCGSSLSSAVSKANLNPGDWVGFDGHIGTFVGGTLVAEFAGGAYAAQLTDINDRKVWDFLKQKYIVRPQWTKFRKPKWYE